MLIIDSIGIEDNGKICKNEIIHRLLNWNTFVSRPPPCTTTQLFDFCWLLFITVKTKDESYSKDLVMSHHLLHACCDWIFQNAFIDERKDLLNPNFACKYFIFMFFLASSRLLTFHFYVQLELWEYMHINILGFNVIYIIYT